jgi:hypothetical protein
VTAMSTAGGASGLAHGLHYGAVLVGLLGLTALLLPHALEPLRHAEAAPHDEHEQRIRALRRVAASGRLGTSDAVALLSAATSGIRPRSRAEAAALAVPLAVVGSAAAAGAHAAVAPAHLAQSVGLGLFFLVAAVAQAGWAALALTRVTRRLLLVGAAANLAVLTLWLTTRLVGLPFGLMPEPHPVGAWDLTCALWEVAVVAGCLWTVRRGAPRRVAGWFDWHPGVRVALIGSVFALLTLTFVGGHA